jgi:FAD/FMN-containing dehydrogenase
MDKIKKCQKEISDKFQLKTRIAKDELSAQKYWIIRRESFNLLRKHVKNKKTAPFIDDLIVLPEYLPEFLPKLNVILDQYKDDMIYTIQGHPGDGNFHIIPLMDLSDDKSRQIIPELSNRVYNLVLEYHGSITAEHNDGLIRTPYLEKMYGSEVYRLFEMTKQIFDPKNIFNPRKKVGSDMSYAMKHIKSGN